VIATTTAATRRRHVIRTAASLSIFLTGILFGEAINAFADESAAAQARPGWDAVDAAATQIEDALALREFATADVLDALAKGELDADGYLANAADWMPADRQHIWDRLADCESGEWSGSGMPAGDSARWDYGTNPGENGFFEGGIQFHPRTWDAYRDADMPSHAGLATRQQQIIVGERVLADQTWRAWPACSLKLGYR